MSVTKKDHEVQIIAAIIGAVAVIVAAFITPLFNHYLTKSENGDPDIASAIITDDEGSQPQTTVSSRENGFQFNEFVEKQKEGDRREKTGSVAATTSNVPVTPIPHENDAHGENSVQIVTVFAGHDFMLCGYQDFSAQIEKTTSGSSELKIRSMDSNIPDRQFQGYEKIVATDEWLNLWPDCSVRFSYENIKDTARIVVSYLRR